MLTVYHSELIKNTKKKVIIKKKLISIISVLDHQLSFPIFFLPFIIAKYKLILLDGELNHVKNYGGQIRKS